MGHLTPAKFYHNFKLFASGVLASQQQRTIPSGGHRLDELGGGELEDFHNSADLSSDFASGGGHAQLARRDNQPTQPIERGVFDVGFFERLHLNNTPQN